MSRLFLLNPDHRAGRVAKQRVEKQYDCQHWNDGEFQNVSEFQRKNKNKRKDKSRIKRPRVEETIENQDICDKNNIIWMKINELPNKD